MSTTQAQEGWKPGIRSVRLSLPGLALLCCAAFWSEVCQVAGLSKTSQLRFCMGSPSSLQRITSSSCSFNKSLLRNIFHFFGTYLLFRYSLLFYINSRCAAQWSDIYRI